MEEELRQKIEELQSDLVSFKKQFDDKILEIDSLKEAFDNVFDRLARHRHSVQDDTPPVEHKLKNGSKITFPGQTTQYEIYRPDGDGTALIIDPVNDGQNESIQIGSVNKPISVSITGHDEAILRANNNTNISYLIMGPGSAGFFTDIGNNFTFRLPAGTGDPSSTSTGALAVVNGVLKIYTGSSWTVVGTQT